MAQMLALVPPLPVEAARTRKPNRRKGSVPAPSNVIQLPTPDADIPVAARYLLRQGWSWLDAAHAGLDMDLAAAMCVMETSPPCPG